MAALEFASEFPAFTEDAWEAAVAAVLQRSGTSAEALSTPTDDGFVLRPLYDGPAEVAGVPATPGWDVRPRYADPDALRANRAMHDDLAQGATSVWLVVGDGGVAVDDLDRVLDGVPLDTVGVALDAGDVTPAAADALLSVAAQQGHARAVLTGSFGFDPLGTAARTGQADRTADIAGVLHRVADAPALRAMTVDGTIYHDAGATDADELAIATSVGVAYLRALTDAGLDVEAALNRLEFRLAVTVDQFASIAKLRAARRLWARVAQLCGAPVTARRQHLHAVTSQVMLTRRDPWTNLLRTTIATFVAVTGGADAITVAPFDAALGIPDALGRRIARNTATILHDESSLRRVIDPAAGSGYVEARTAELAGAAWTRFTALERAGGASNLGAVRALATGAPANARPLVGVTVFPDLDESLLERPAVPVRRDDGLPVRRWAANDEGPA